MNYINIQNEVIQKYRIDICHGDKCRNDWQRTHAHVKIRRVCKWKQANSVQSTFTLFHEVGHIETTKSTMRRAESEYYATVWAIDLCNQYGIEIPDKIIERYQKYIDMEIDRGQRRGGTGYGSLNLWDYIGGESGRAYGVSVYELDPETFDLAERISYQQYPSNAEAVKYYRMTDPKPWEMVQLWCRDSNGAEVVELKLGEQN